MFCRFCGRPLNYPGQMYCTGCGAFVGPEKKSKSMGSKIGAFFLALLKCLGYFAVFFGVSLVFQFVYEMAVIVGLKGQDISDPNGYSGLSDAFWSEFSRNFCWMMALAYIAIILVYIIIFACRKKTLWNEANIRKVQFAALPAAMAFGVCLQVATTFLIAYLSALFPAVADSAAQSSDSYDVMFQSSSVLSQVVFSAVLTPVLEELLFRGLIYTRMKKAMPTVVAMILSAVAFGAAHTGVVQFLYAGLLGLLMAVLYEKYNSLWVPIFMHAGFNATNYIYELLNMDSLLVQFSVMGFAAAGVILFTVYFFISKPIYKEDKIDEAV